MHSGKTGPAFSASHFTQGEVFVWQPRGSPFSVTTSWQAAERMLLQAMRGNKGSGESGGLLLGSVDWNPKPSLTIDQVEPLPWPSAGAENHTEFVAALGRQASGGSRRVLGYYRTHSDADLFMDAADLMLIKAHFPDPNNVFILLRSGHSGTLNARWFFRYRESLRSEEADPGFPFGRPAPAGTDAPERFTGDEPLREPRAAGRRADEAMRRAGKSWVWPGLAAAVFAAVLYLGWTRPGPGSRVAPLRSAPDVSSAQQLGLTVEKQSNDLLIRWDRTSPPVLRAQRAVLNVQDGMYIRPYQLDADQLRTGSIYYTPLSGDVQFRLEVYDEANRGAVESVRVLSTGTLSGTLPPPPVPLSNPYTADLEPRTVSPRYSERSRRAIEPEAAERAVPAAPVARTTYLQFTPRRSEAERSTPLEAPPRVDQDPAVIASAAAPGVPGLHPSLSVPAPLPTAASQQLPSDARRALPVQPPAPAPKMTQPEPTQTAPATSEPVKVSSYVAPVPLRQAQPVVSDSVRAMIKSELTVSVRVFIDEQGKVTRAEVAGRKGPFSGFVIEPALNAARRWRFRPATSGGRAVPSDMIVNFRFVR